MMRYALLILLIITTLQGYCQHDDVMDPWRMVRKPVSSDKLVADTISAYVHRCYTDHPVLDSVAIWKTDTITQKQMLTEELNYIKIFDHIDYNFMDGFSRYRYEIMPRKYYIEVDKEYVIQDENRNWKCIKAFDPGIKVDDSLVSMDTVWVEDEQQRMVTAVIKKKRDLDPERVREDQARIDSIKKCPEYRDAKIVVERINYVMDSLEREIPNADSVHKTYYVALTHLFPHQYSAKVVYGDWFEDVYMDKGYSVLFELYLNLVIDDIPDVPYNLIGMKPPESMEEH